MTPEFPAPTEEEIQWLCNESPDQGIRVPQPSLLQEERSFQRAVLAYLLDLRNGALGSEEALDEDNPVDVDLDRSDYMLEEEPGGFDDDDELEDEIGMDEGMDASLDMNTIICEIEERLATQLGLGVPTVRDEDENFWATPLMQMIYGPRGRRVYKQKDDLEDFLGTLNRVLDEITGDQHVNFDFVDRVNYVIESLGLCDEAKRWDIGIRKRLHQGFLHEGALKAPLTFDLYALPYFRQLQEQTDGFIEVADSMRDYSGDATLVVVPAKAVFASDVDAWEESGDPRVNQVFSARGLRKSPNMDYCIPASLEEADYLVVEKLRK